MLMHHVSCTPSKIPYVGFSPVRLQTGIQPRPSSTMLSLSARPTYTQSPQIYTRLKSLSPKRALFRRGTFVQAGLSLSYTDHPVQRSLAPQRVMLPDGIASPTPARTFTFELSPPGSPLGDVEYHYAGKQPTPAAGLTPARQTTV